MKTLFLSLISVITLIQPQVLKAEEIPAQLKALHVLNRLGFGPRPGDIDRVNAMGVEQYIHQQLFPETIAEPSQLTQKLNELRTYSLDPSELFKEYGPPPETDGTKSETYISLREQRKKKAKIILQEAIQARLMRAIESPRQLQEVMVDFWFNHFNVASQKEAAHLWVGNYEREAIRPYVLGHFRDLLEATAKHPAMIYYLDNWRNGAPGNNRMDPRAKKSYELNENYARELMELHTLGVNGGYTQDDVIALMHILTGWGFHPNARNTGNIEFFFNEKRHDNSDQVLLGQTISQKGKQGVEKAFDILVKSPATARHISFQLAQYFVADDPDPALVEKLAQKFEETDGDIRAMLQVIFESPQFWDEKNYGNKFKTPDQYIISVIRASGEKVTNYSPVINILRQLGMPFYECPTPDGYKNTQEAWLNPDGMLRRINFAIAFALGRININDDQSQIHYKDIMRVFDYSLSSPTMNMIQKEPARLRAALVLSSPEMMRK
jgi:uncharacterized protein (DUF1800 family)